MTGRAKALLLVHKGAQSANKSNTGPMSSFIFFWYWYLKIDLRRELVNHLPLRGQLVKQKTCCLFFFFSHSVGWSGWFSSLEGRKTDSRDWRETHHRRTHSQSRRSCSPRHDFRILKTLSPRTVNAMVTLFCSFLKPRLPLCSENLSKFPTQSPSVPLQRTTMKHVDQSPFCPRYCRHF